MNRERDFFQSPALPLSLWAAYHLVVWTILPLLCNTCLPLDSIEAVMWGSQWEWGYDKHPPLSAWAPELFTTLLGDAGLYLLSQLCVVIAGLGIYKIGRLFKLTVRQCIFAVLLLDMVYYYQFISVEFNVNIMQLPFWAWGWFFGIDALQNRRFSSWLGLGACIAFGALTKYIAVFMLVPLFAAWWRRGELKKALMSPGLYVAALVSVLIFLPHLVWMKNHDWITITYGLKRGGGEEGVWWHHLWYPLEFLLAQAAILAPLIIVSIAGKIRSQEPGRGIPGAMALGIGCFVFLAAFSFITGMAPVTMWAAPMPLAIGIWLVPRFNLDRFPRTFFSFLVLLSLTFTIGYGVTYGAGHLIREKPHRVTYPGKALAAAVEELWHSKYNTPLDYIVADEFLGGIVNYYGRDGAAVMISADPVRSTYLTTDDIRQHGAVVLWLKSRRSDSPEQLKLNQIYPHLNDYFSTVEIQTDLIIPWPRRKDGLAGRYGIAYIAPEGRHE